VIVAESAGAAGEVAEVAGRLRDLDSHLLVPPDHLRESIGPLGGLAGGVMRRDPRVRGALDAGEEDAGPESVWKTKGFAAPGAFDLTRRVAALDLMGIERQLVLPAVMIALAVWSPPGRGAGIARRYNRFVAEWAAPRRDRVVPTGLLPTGDVAAIAREIDAALDVGIGAFTIPHGRPMADVSPASPGFDRVWARLAEAGAPAILHVGGEMGFTSKRWAQTPELERLAAADNPESEPIGPWLLASLGSSPANYLTTLVYGGVLERHPGLRLGAIEMGAQWLGPLAEVLDQRVGMSSRTRTLRSKPSEYLRRQLRVTPFPQEPVDVYLDRWGLDEVWSFSSDFPHAEGGTAPLTDYARMLAGPDRRAQRQAFFVDNGSLLIG
jgi:predicted TIM-barrel fold metal-dependent hydrolase